MFPRYHLPLDVANHRRCGGSLVARRTDSYPEGELSHGNGEMADSLHLGMSEARLLLTGGFGGMPCTGLHSPGSLLQHGFSRLLFPIVAGVFS